MLEPKIEEWLALNQPDGASPPGVWVTAGQLNGEYGMFIGEHKEVLCFIPEAKLDAYVVILELEGWPELAQMIENLKPDLARLKAGTERLAVDLAFRKIRYDA